MKIKYYIDLEEVNNGEYENINVPRPGDKVWLDDLFYVDDVIWYPATNDVRVYLKQEDFKEIAPKIANVQESSVNLGQVNRAQSIADKALKETVSLKRQVFSIRNFIKTQQGKNK
jgi:hypothetical protein